MAETKNDREWECALRQLDRLVARARAVLFWEQLWRALVPPLFVVGLFVAVSFAGLWLEIGPLWRELGAGLFGIAFVAAFVPLFGLRPPARKAALARIDQNSDLTHGPASGLDDELANAGADPTTQALWNLHRKRLLSRVGRLRVGAPSPRVANLDPYSIRAAFSSSSLQAPSSRARKNMRASPLRSIGGPPRRSKRAIGSTPGSIRRPTPANRRCCLKLGQPDQATKVEAPINSVLIVRGAGGDVGVETQGGLEAAKEHDAPQAPGETEHRLTLRGDAQLTLKHAGATVGSFAISVIPDNPPEIELTDAPRYNARGSLHSPTRSTTITAPFPPKRFLPIRMSMASPGRCVRSLSAASLPGPAARRHRRGRDDGRSVRSSVVRRARDDDARRA